MINGNNHQEKQTNKQTSKQIFCKLTDKLKTHEKRTSNKAGEIILEKLNYPSKFQYGIKLKLKADKLKFDSLQHIIFLTVYTHTFQCSLPNFCVRLASHLMTLLLLQECFQSIFYILTLYFM